MKLSAPTMVVFLIAIIVAILALLSGLGIFTIIPIAAFWLMTIAFGVLAAGCLFKGV